MVADGGGINGAASAPSTSASAAMGATAVSTGSLSPEAVAALRSRLEELEKKALSKGDTWYLVDQRWFKQLQAYLGQDSGVIPASDKHKAAGKKVAASDSSAFPGPVDNSALFKDDGSGDIREHMIDELDYRLVPEEGWNLLVEHFGVVEGQEPVARRVVEHGMFVKHCRVEVYFIELQLARDPDTKTLKKAKFSKSDTLEAIAKEMKRLYEIPESAEIRLWNKYSPDTYEQLANLENTAQDSGLYGGQVLLIETKRPDGSWPRVARNTSSLVNINSNGGESGGESTTANNKTAASSNNGAVSKPAASQQQNRESTPGPSTSNAVAGPISTRYNFGSNSGEVGQSDKAQPGLCGLSNLGNTCFMNSIIQGLSNCPPITEYFANDNYVEDINEDNPLGMKGEIARTFGELIKSLWSGRYSYFVPRNFKMAVGRFAPQFSGYQQQDSQELLTFLLDGLHEDLNRIKQKPYVELRDSDDRPDEDVATEAWDMYKKRNDSVILDLFHGLLKSTVVCPECPKVSVTFDPFCYLSLPLPVRRERRIDVFLVYEDVMAPPKQFKVTVAKNGCMGDLCKALAQLSGVDPAKMVVTDVYNHRFHKIYGPDEAVSHILDRDDIFVYEVPTTDPEDANTMLVPVYLREKKSSLTYSPSNLFGQPMLLGVPRKGSGTAVDYETLYSLALAKMARIVQPPQEGVTWWKKGKKQQQQQQSLTNGNRGDGAANSEDSSPSSSSSGIPAAPAAGESEDAADGNNTSSAAAVPMSEDSNQQQQQDEEMEKGGDEDDDEDDDDEEEEEDGRGPPKLFAMNFVNSYGNAQLEQLCNDGKPISISGKTYLSLDWHSKAKELFYNEKEAENCVAEASGGAQGEKAGQKKQVRLEECLELYTSTEKLGENDAWYCPNCKKHQQATKKFDLWSLPALLVVSLKRFSYNRYWRDKLDTHVEFPVSDLDMSPYVINSNHGPAVYDLVAVSNHYGGMGGGHYTAYAKNKDDGHWYYFDDSSVSSSSPDAVVSKAAYVLFYQRRDLCRDLMADGVGGRAHMMTTPDPPSASSNGKVANGDASSVEDMDTN